MSGFQSNAFPLVHKPHFSIDFGQPINSACWTIRNWGRGRGEIRRGGLRCEKRKTRGSLIIKIKRRKMLMIELFVFKSTALTESFQQSSNKF